MFTLSTDTSCDIFRNELKLAGIEYRPLVYTIDDVPYFDEFTADADYKAFYDLIRAGKMPTTSQINIAEHEEFFGMLAKKYDGDILHITLSSGLSSTYSCACTAAETVNAELGAKRVYVVDSLGATITVRHVVDEAIRLRDEGVSAADAAERLKEFAFRLHTWFMPTDLMHLKRGGRVSSVAAIAGTMLGIKPILSFTSEGKLNVIDKVRGMKRAFSYALDKMDKFPPVKENPVIWVVHTDAEAEANELAALVEAKCGIKPDVTIMGPVIGSHVGPGAVAVLWKSDEVRQDG